MSSVVELEVEEVDPLLVEEIRLWKDILYPVRLLYKLMNYTILSQSHMTTTIQREISTLSIYLLRNKLVRSIKKAERGPMHSHLQTSFDFSFSVQTHEIQSRNKL